MQTSGQPEINETKAGDENPEAVPAPEPDIAGDPSASAPPADASPAPQRKNRRKPPKRKPPKSTGRMLVGLLVKIAVASALIWAVFTFVLGFSVHYGNNMYPSVRDGDLIVSFRLQKPYINAVVLYRVNGKTEVGRVIALEGSVVDIAENGLLTVNGAAPSDEIFYATYQAENSPVSFPYTVEPGKVFILNDFRSDVNDSRTFGAVDRKDLEGPLLFTFRRRNF